MLVRLFILFLIKYVLYVLVFSSLFFGGGSSV